MRSGGDPGGSGEKAEEEAEEGVCVEGEVVRGVLVLLLLLSICCLYAWPSGLW